MGTAFSSEVAGRQAHPTDRPADRGTVAALDARLAAWIAVAPTAAIVIAAIVLLGPSLGAAMYPKPSARFWAVLHDLVRPEPTEQARYLISLAAPLLLAGLTARLVLRPPSRLAPRAAALATAVELTAVLLLVACFVAQRLQAPQNYTGDTRPVVYFTLPSIAAAIAIAAAVAVAARAPQVRARVPAWTRETRVRRIGALVVVLAGIGVALLPAINTDASIAQAFEAVIYHLQFTYDETMAVIDGRSPLGNFAGQYASLWPYVLAGGMSVLGSSLLAFTGLMAAVTGVTLLALYDTLRRLARSSVAGLLLFLPLLATFGFRLHGPAVNRFSLVNYFGVLPLRYAAPFLLAWLTARHLDGARPRRTWPLFLAGGLTVLNNTDFGLAAIAATVLALLWAQPRPGRAALRRGALEAAAGLAAAYALVAALLLARTGSPPDLSLLFRYADTFAVEGFAMLRIRPLFGVDLAIYATYVAAIGVATVRALRRDSERALTGLLAWSGIFGLGAGSYYVGHSLSELVIYTFPAWSLSLVLLTLATVRELATVRRRPRPSELACLVGFGLLACSLAQLPLPWQQLQRITSHGPEIFAQPQGQELVAAYARRGEPVLIISPLGHRMAATLGLDDVEPYTGARSIFTLEQLEESVAALRAAGGRDVFVLTAEYAYSGMTEQLVPQYRLETRSPEGMELWVPR